MSIASTEAFMSPSLYSNRKPSASRIPIQQMPIKMTNGPDSESINVHGGSSSRSKLTTTIKEQFELRLAADPNFVSKSITEVILAAGTQFTAEFTRRGASNIIPQIDFVIAGIFTAIAGKYYSMWRVAPTFTKGANERDNSCTAENSDSDSTTVSHGGGGGVSIPTNAFQTDKSYSLVQRGMAFILPIPSLFKAGFIASAIGYGLTQILISLRSILVPSYVAATANINILHACLYTGGFMAFVSNIRYQLLQGIVEPMVVEKLFWKFPIIKAAAIFAVRLANGLLGSSLAIAGMTFFGLQKLK